MRAIAESQATELQHSAGCPVIRSRAILAAMTQLGGLQIVLASTGLIRNKVAALYLKASGIGEWSQILGVATTVFVIVQFGMIISLSRSSAAASSESERQRQLSVANTLTMGVTLATVLAFTVLFLIPSSGRLLTSLGISPGLAWVLLVLVVLLAPIEALRNNYLSLLQGILDIHGITAKRATAVILTTLAAIPLVVLFGIKGACLQFAIGSILLAVLLGHRCRQLGYRPLQFQWERRSAVALATLGGATLVAGFASGLVDVLIRSQLIRYAGLAETGLYQAAFLLSSQVTQVVLASVGVLSLASISRSTEPAVISEQLRVMYKVILPISAVGLGSLGLLERPMVQLLFSAQFGSSSLYLPLLLIGNSLQAACWVAGAPLLGCGLVRTWFTLQLVGASLRYLTVAALLPVLGTQAIPLAFLLGQVFDLVASVVVCSRRMKIFTSGADLARIGLSAAVPGILGLIGLNATPATVSAGMIILAAGTVTLAPAQCSRLAISATGFALRRCSTFKAKAL